MTGSLLYEDEPGEYAGRAVHVVFSLTEGRLLYRDIRTLGCLWLVPTKGPTGIKGYDNLGPDAISPDFTAEGLYRFLKETRRPVKTVLLDQTKVAGIGNIYADEALFGPESVPCAEAVRSRKKKRRNSMGLSRLFSKKVSNTAVRRYGISSAAMAKKGRTRKTSASTAAKGHRVRSAARPLNT